LSAVDREAQSLRPSRLSVFVTVGMGPWPFDRLMTALSAVCEHHDVFVQSGTSSVAPPCRHSAFLGYEETQRRLSEADVVITHGGNTVRLVQRMGKVPIVVAREATRGEMRNDHQVRYVHTEAEAGRVVALDGSLEGLADAVSGHPDREQTMLRSAAPLSMVESARLVDTLEAARRESDATGSADPNPFLRHPTARYRWAFEQLRGRSGRHLDLGVGGSEFVGALHRRTPLDVVGADPHAGYLAAARSRHRDLELVRVGDRLPFADGAFDSASMLDVLEHTRSEPAALAEVGRVLRPGGLLVLTVPAHHVFSVLDPDNVKFRFPRLHRAVYSARFGRATYERRFRDDADGLRGDMAWEKRWHTNYDPGELVALVEGAGLVPRARDGANLFWRFFQVPALLSPEPVRGLFDPVLRLDGRLFRRANLFLTAVRGEDAVPAGESA
jgi:SAM-dependent methyltransferase